MAIAVTRKDSEQVGLNKARRWLERYEPPPIEAELDQQLKEFIAERESEIPDTLQ